MSDNKKVEEIMGCIRWKKLGKGTYIDLDATKAEIRKLLPPRPSVTREEVYCLLRELDDRYGINCVNSVTFEIMELLKSKGIDVKEEK